MGEGKGKLKGKGRDYVTVDSRLPHKLK